MATDDNEKIHEGEQLFDIWGHRNPRFEKRYEHNVLRVITDYGIGASENTEAKGKILGAGYEAYIMAFFIGLYADKKLPLSENSADLKVLGQPIEKWGNLDSKKFRKAYPKLRGYIFDALVANTNIDWISLDKGITKASAEVTKLVSTMEEYANYGFAVMEDKLKEDKSYFFSQRAFLDLFMQLTEKKSSNEEQNSLTSDNKAEAL